MNEHKCKVGDRVEVRHFDGHTWRGVVLELGRENDIGGDREDGYKILADNSSVTGWAWDYSVRKLSVLELLAEAASG